ncbi:MAG TPA: hypothetical protein VJA21_06740 [Verrucomicrobiae bacterium]
MKTNQIAQVNNAFLAMRRYGRRGLASRRKMRLVWSGGMLAAAMMVAVPLRAQTLINIDFGVGAASAKRGLAATGMGTNDFWNLYRHYDPKFTPGMPLVSDGKLEKAKLADSAESGVAIAVKNAPGVWGNASGDPMYDTYIFAQNGSNISVRVEGLAAGRYHFYLYGHADPDVAGEQNSSFTLTAGTNTLGPLAQMGGSGWKVGQPWQERAHYVVFRDIPVDETPVTIEVAAGPNGVAVLNGLQIVSRGTSPPRLLVATPPPAGPVSTNLLFREIRYDGKVSDNEARFAVTFEAESLTTNEISAPLFEGDVALVLPEVPDGLRIVSEGRRTRLFCAAPGSYRVKLELIAKITRSEPWNQVTFTGPAAAIASVKAKASREGVELQMLSGTQVSRTGSAAANVNALTAPLEGFLGPDRTVSMRWQSRAAEVARKSLVTVETTASAQITPTVVKFVTALRYEILQAPIPRLTIELPPTHALTKIQGDQIRDWQVKPDGERQVLSVEFIKPVENSCALTLFSEQTVEATPLTARLVPPQPLEVEREAGSFTVSADDMTVEINSAPGLRQVNAPSGTLAAYRFNARPIALETKLERILPVLKLTDRVSARLEETRFIVSHALNLGVEKAGIYALELALQPGFLVSGMKGDGIEDWKVADGLIQISFSSRVLGARKIDVQLEQANKEFPDRIVLLPLGVRGATNVITQLGASSSPGIRLKTAELSSLREIPVSSLPNRTDELLAFASEQPDWKLTLGTEKLSARLVAEVFNLVTIGDGQVGGSATIRYGIVNQGVQEFRVAVPAHWRNIEFTGANIRRKEQQTNVWTITLQEKAWGGYTLVLTYDYQFDPKGSTLDLAGAHTVGLEREAGSLGVMTAASLKLTPAAPVDPLRRVDEAELSESLRALCTRPLPLAYKYAGPDYRHSVQVTRFEELPVLEAVADRIELTTVLTEEGQLLNQASFMVKNNEKQFQRFKLPGGSEFWSSYVNSQPAKPERDGDWLLVPLPRDANRDQAFAVDIVYDQKIDLRTSLFPRRVHLTAPLTDIPNTYAEWQLFVPVSQRVSRFEGTMTVAGGTTYDWRDAWQRFLQFYGDLIERHFGFLLFCFGLALFVVLVVAAARRGFRGAVAVLVTFAIVAVLAAMMLPALSRAKSRAQRISAVNNLKQIGLAAKTWSLDNGGGSMPPNYEAMMNELSTAKVTIDPNTGRRFIWVGAGKSDTTPEAILAYSPSDVGGRAVLFADGSVQVMSAEKFQEALVRDAAVPRLPFSTNALINAPVVAESPAPPASAQPLPPQRPGLPPPPATPMAVAQPPPAAPPPAAAGAAQIRPTTSGVRPIRIDVPRTGQSFNFTKVLNAGQEPLSVSLSMMRLKTWRTLQMVVQVCAFTFGLVMLWWLILLPTRKTFWMAVAAALIIWSVANLLIMWRLLHLGLIVAMPSVVAGLATWIGWRAWERWRAARGSHGAQPPPSVPPAGTGAPAAVTLLTFLAFITAALPVIAEDLGTTAISNAVSIVSAGYTGTVNDKVAQFEATIQISTSATNQHVPLFLGDVAIESFSAEGEARLVREGGSVGVLLPRRGMANLTCRLVAKLGGDVTRRQLGFHIPPALSSRVALVLDEPDADVEFPTAVTFERTSVNQQTRVEAVIGAVERLELNWTPRVKRAAEIAATVFVQSSALVSLGGGVMNTRATLDYQVSQGELKQVRLQVPAGQRLLRVDGASIRSWEMKDDRLVVDLLKGVSPSYKLTVETESLLARLPVTVQIEVPHALEVKRETGLIAVRGSDELSLVVEAAKEVQRVDAEEYQRVSQDKLDGILSAFRFFKTDFALSVRAEPVQAQVEAVVRDSIRIGSESVQLSARVDYLIKRAGLFTLRLALPEVYRLDSVAGTNISQWVERTEENSRVLEVNLKERTIGKYDLNLVLTRNYKEPPGRLAVVGVHPLETQKLSGFVSVTAEHGIAAKTESFDGLSEIPLTDVPGERGVAGTGMLAYKFVAGAGTAPPGWRLTVSTEAVEPWVRAEVMNTISISETLVSGRTLVKYDIANAPIKEFRVRLPAGFKNIEITGGQIRRRDETNGEWRVELQSKVRGEYVLGVTWEFSKDEKTNAVELAGVHALGVERETGFVAVNARPPLQVADKAADELLSKIDVRELPEWAGPADAAAVLAYRYVRSGYRLALEARRFDQAEVLQALIDSARLTTVVADDGQIMTEVALTIRNNGRQHLEIELPGQTTVWSAFVMGEPVRPSKREGKLLLPLAREVASDAPLPVELTFVGTEQFPKHRGRVSLASPKFDLPLKNARWDLYLPPDYEYSRFEGSMSRSITTDLIVPQEQVYSLSEYNDQNRAQAEQQKMEMRYGLKEARENLTGGNLRQAFSSFKRSKAKGQQFKQAADEDRDLKQVEQDLRRAQSSNLIAAQNNYYFENAAKLGDQQMIQLQTAQPAPAQTMQQRALPQGQMGGLAANYDIDVAGLQWDKLEKAQQVAAKKVAPLRVNLPTRGVRFSFSQVLQTELRKPMTVKLLAENTKVPSWTTRLGLSLLGFGGLWVILALLARRRSRTCPARLTAGSD